ASLAKGGRLAWGGKCGMTEEIALAALAMTENGFRFLIICHNPYKIPKTNIMPTGQYNSGLPAKLWRQFVSPEKLNIPAVFKIFSPRSFSGEAELKTDICVVRPKKSWG
ncbi:MAG: hypothetical protein AAB626_02310, partial [Patescibacteria group bacterium]